MIKSHEEERTRTSKETIVDGMFCDSCGKKAACGWKESWTNGYNFDHIIIRRETGSRFPDGGNETS